MSYASIRKELLDLTDDELLKLNRELGAILKSRRRAVNAFTAAMGTFKTGDKVYFDGKRGRVYGTVTKVNRTKVVVDDGGYHGWIVPMSMLRTEA